MSFRSWIGRQFGLYGDEAKRFWASFGAPNFSGEPVTLERAMGVMAFWRGVRLIATTIGTLPPTIYRADGANGEGVEDRNNQYDALVRVSPNDSQTPCEFWEAISAAEIVLGNGYALKKAIGGRLVALELLDPCATYPFRNSQGALRYRGSDFQGTKYNDLAPDEVYHQKGFSFGGDCGMSAIQFGASALGLSIAANRVAGQTFASGLSSSGFLETQAVLNEPDRARLEKIMSDYQENKSPGKMMILEGGMKFNKLSLSAVDAQLLETMGFNIEEIARLLELPPVMLGHASAGQTMWGTGVEAIIQAWYNLGLRAKLTRTEKAFQKRVISPADAGKFYLKFNVDGLLRGDTQTRALIAATLAQNGLRSRDELRALDDYQAIPGGGGKLFTAQVNLSPLDQLKEPKQSQPADGNPVDQAVRNMVERVLLERAAEDELRRRIADQRRAA